MPDMLGKINEYICTNSQINAMHAHHLHPVGQVNAPEINQVLNLRFDFILIAGPSEIVVQEVLRHISNRVCVVYALLSFVQDVWINIRRQYLKPDVGVFVDEKMLEYNGECIGFIAGRTGSAPDAYSWMWSVLFFCDQLRDN